MNRTDKQGIPILTATQTRAAEQVIFDAGVPVIDLMEKAGDAVARAIREHFPPSETLILCGPGNNGGDGYVVARLLSEAGWQVRVAASAAPTTEEASIARNRWTGSVEALSAAPPAPLLVDALFGTGLTRAIDPAIAIPFNLLSEQPRHRIAIDIPSGIGTDDGVAYGEVPQFDLTIALGVFKPAHANPFCGEVVLGDIGLIDIARQLVNPSTASPAKSG
jgi:hydroxyethylthiazole kinase-like uncharacterized protein yjeF